MKYLIILLLCIGCASPGIPNGEHVVHVPAMAIIITDECLPDGLFGFAEWAEDGGYRIFIKGKQTSKGIDISDMVMGHEYRHILNFLDKKIKDPHLDWKYRLLRGWYK